MMVMGKLRNANGQSVDGQGSMQTTVPPLFIEWNGGKMGDEVVWVPPREKGQDWIVRIMPVRRR